MKLNKRHIGQLFDCVGGDGSWYYQLVAIKKGKLLFNVNGESGKFDISSDKHRDWRPFIHTTPFSKDYIKWAWANGRMEE